MLCLKIPNLPTNINQDHILLFPNSYKTPKDIFRRRYIDNILPSSSSNCHIRIFVAVQ